MVVEATMALKILSSSLSNFCHLIFILITCIISIGKAWSRLHIKKSYKSSLKNLDSRDVQRERL